MIGRSGYARQPSEAHFSSNDGSIAERGLQMTGLRADIGNVRLRRRPSTDERIAQAFAEAVAAGNLDAAEGWLTVAMLRANRSRDRRSGATQELAGRRIPR
jgi:hypothetical protein